MCVNRLRNGETVIGTMIGLSTSPAVVRIAKNVGLDYVMLDMEHGPASYEKLSVLTAASGGAGIGCSVRVPELSRRYVSRALDCGAGGARAPLIETVAPARTAVVGDTLGDLLMGERAGVGLRVAVLTGAGQAAQLASHADVVLASIDEIAPGGEDGQAPPSRGRLQYSDSRKGPYSTSQDNPSSFSLP